MGALFFFDDLVPVDVRGTAEAFCQVEVVDNHGVPELRVGPAGAAPEGTIARFTRWEQFETFVDAVNELRSRLAPSKS